MDTANRKDDDAVPVADRVNNITSTCTTGKRNFDAMELSSQKPNYFQHRMVFQLQNGDWVIARLQDDKYYPFSKRCVRLIKAHLSPRLPGNLTNGAFLFQSFKRDYKDEFELLPRCGQKTGSQSDTEEWRFEHRLAKVYSRLRSAYDCPRYLELWRKEVGEQLRVPITAELHWQTGGVSSFHSSLGCFGKYFGVVLDGGDVMDPLSQTKRLNPFEAFFLADAGTLQVTASQCPLAVEDLRAILEAKVRNFSRRYLVFSELLRTSRYSVKLYSKEPELQYRQLAVAPSFPVIPSHGVSRPFGASFGQNHRTSTENCPRRHIPNAVGFFAKVDLDKARELLQLPPVSDDCVVTLPPGLVKDEDACVAVIQPNPSCPIGRLRPEPIRAMRVARPRGIDLAFYGCMKDFDVTPPEFDVAITDYRDQSVPVSALFQLMENRKNSRIPLLMERVDCGQISGYSMTNAAIPPVDYCGRQRVALHG